MKKYFLLVLFLLILVFFGCSSVKNLNDYDNVTYQKKNYLGERTLGTVKVSKLGFVWEKFYPTDKKSIIMMQKLEKEALKKYGQNIKIINASIGGMNGGITTALWVGGGAVFTGAAVASSSFTEEVSKNGKTETEITNENGYNTAMGIALGSLAVFLFKGIEATATVIESDTPYKIGSYYLISDEQIEEKQNEYYRNKIELDQKAKEEQWKLEAEQRQSEQENRYQQLKTEKEQNLKLFVNLKNQLISRGKNVGSPVVVLEKDVEETSAYTDGISCYVEFINITDKVAKYVKFDFTPYNRVFDQAYSHIDGTSNKTVTVTNFIGPNETYYAKWENVWFNSTIEYIKLTKVEMIFADNTSLIINNPDKLKQTEFSENEQLQYNKIKSYLNNSEK